MINRRARHHRSGGGHGVPQIVEFLDMGVVQLPKVIPNAGVRGNHIGLVAAIHDHVVGALLEAKVFPAEIPANVHEFDGIQSAAARPWRTGSVGSTAVKEILHADKTAPFTVAGTVGGGEFRFNMRPKYDVNVLKITCAH